MRSSRSLFAPPLLVLAFAGMWPNALPAVEPHLKIEHFDNDPRWEGHNNRIEIKSVPVVKQDFGYSATQFAGKEKGELGGRVTRTTRPAYYAAKLGPKTLDDRLTASGTFAITESQAGAGLFFGFFNSQQPGGSGRPIGSLGLDMDFERKGRGLRCGSSPALIRRAAHLLHRICRASIAPRRSRRTARAINGRSTTIRRARAEMDASLSRCTATIICCP